MLSAVVRRLSAVLCVVGVSALVPAGPFAPATEDRAFAAAPSVAASCAVALHLSDSADRSAASALSGAAVRRNRFVFVDAPGASGRDQSESTTPIESVRFTLRRVGASSSSVLTEGEAPFDLKGTDVRGAARPLTTRTLADGAWTVSAAWTYKSGQCDGSVRTATAAFAVRNSGPGTVGDCALTTLVSTKPDRAGAKPLSGAVVRGKVYFFVGNSLGSTRDLFPASTVLSAVAFSLDAADGTPGSSPYPGPPLTRNETVAPFDFAGGTGGRAGTGDPLASAWDSSKFPVGEYTLGASYTFGDDSIFGCGDENHATNASFTVAR